MNRKGALRAVGQRITGGSQNYSSATVGGGGNGGNGGGALSGHGWQTGQGGQRGDGIADGHGAGNLDSLVAAGIGGVVSHHVSAGGIHINGVAADSGAAQAGVAGVADTGALFGVRAGMAFQR